MTAAARRRAELMLLRARYDCGAVPPGVYAAIKELETAISWDEHHDRDVVFRPGLRAETPVVADAFAALIGGEEMEQLEQKFEADFDRVFGTGAADVPTRSGR